MKKHSFIARVIIPLLFLAGCDWPETVVTSIVHPDGSVTRKVVMKNDKQEISPSAYRVPVDSTWGRSVTMEMREQDTVWVFTFEKTFASVDEINAAYKADTGQNRMLRRSAEFTRRFRWFNTFYRFSEKVENTLNTELKAEDFLNEEELKYFYMPSPMFDSLLNSPDSLHYKEIATHMEEKEEEYASRALLNEWAHYYLSLNPDSAYIYARLDSLMEKSLPGMSEDSAFILVLGEDYYRKHKADIDTAGSMLGKAFDQSFSGKFYTCEIVMPAGLVATNGFVGDDGKISWPVESKHYMSQDYVMWAESKQVNRWAWIVSGIFILFVLAGLVVKVVRK